MSVYIREQPRGSGQQQKISEMVEVTSRQRPRVIAGFGRSGTTWVQDALAVANSARAVFEPLHPHLTGPANVCAHSFRAAQDDDSVLYWYLHKYFFEDFHSLWADYRVIRSKLVPRRNDWTSIQALKRVLAQNIRAKQDILRFRKQRRNSRRIVKFVRANFLLSWLQEKFDARIVFIVRHPAAVVLSQLRAPGAWNQQESIERYRADSALLEVIDDRTRQLMLQPLGNVEMCTLSWCIENKIALSQAEMGAIPVVYYERLVASGKPEWLRILSALDLDIMPDRTLISRPSQQTWGEKARDSALVRQYSSWMESIDRPTALRIQAVLDATGMNIYNVNEALPWMTAELSARKIKSDRVKSCESGGTKAT